MKPAACLMRCCSLLVALIAILAAAPAEAAQLSAKEVLRSINDGKELLIKRQEKDGSWRAGNEQKTVGATSLAVMALLNSGMSPDEPPARRGLEYLRGVNPGDIGSFETYQISLQIMALAAAKNPRRDQAKLLNLTSRLEAGQLTEGENAGSWSYSLKGGWGDRSNGQFAALALREAAFAGVPVSRRTWERIRDHWVASQNADGGWAYAGLPRMGSYGSMTVAGISTLSIVKTMLRKDNLQPDGTPDCCGGQEPDAVDQALEQAYRWMGKNFAVTHNPNNSGWVLYYLYGLERAGRLSGRRFFGDHDWYREGASYLITIQSPRGSWQGLGGDENDPTIGTAFALLFLSKGLAPVLINKMKYGEEEEDPDWRLHPDDSRNLTEFISGRPKWPTLLTWQVLDLEKVTGGGGLADLLQAPVLYINGREPPEFTDEQVKLLRDYVDQGGFIFIVSGCNRQFYDPALRTLIERMYPNQEAQLKRLTGDHPVFWSEFPLDPDAVELWGVDVGCRTSVIYSPDDLGCLWDHWLPFEPRGRPPALSSMVLQKMRIGVNVIAYATGREPPTKLDVATPQTDQQEGDPIERGLLQIAKLRHGGTWNAAPRALGNLLRALNQKVGGGASTKPAELVATDPDIYKYPILYMHGRTNFSLSAAELERMREHLDRGAVLFADACCGAAAFDASFRAAMKQLYPNHELKLISPDHELYSPRVGEDLSRVRRRDPGSSVEGTLNADVVIGAPVLEGIEVNGRLAVIYSKYDISCALERQSSAACAGYLPEDALKIALNIILYAMLQDVPLPEEVGK